MRACEVMTRDLNCCTPSFAARMAAMLLGRFDVGILPVVDDLLSRKLLGEVTDRDLGRWRRNMDAKGWQCGFVSQLTDRLRTKLLGIGDKFSYHAGDVIFREGDRSTHMYLVKQGHVELGKTIADRGARPFAIIGPGDIFSWSALVKSQVETATARAIDEVDVIGINGAAVDDLCWQDPEAGLELYRAVLEVVSARLKAMAATLSNSGDEHVLAATRGSP